MKKIIYSALIVILISACTDKADSYDSEKLKRKGSTMDNEKKATIMQIVKLKTELSQDELLKIAKEREPQFKAIPGLLQKYYIKLDRPGEYGGVYIWDSAESLKEFKASELAATIPQAYKVIESPSIEIVDILFKLRE